MQQAGDADRADLTSPATYPQHPPKRCDVVMKGGVTSGIVYPLAICELARTYAFQNIGGTSAGAIAAACTAAAEFGRRRAAPGGGFARVAALPGELGAAGRLFALFRPQSATAPLFNILVALTDRRAGGWWPALLAALAGFKVPTLLGTLPGLLALALALVVAGRGDSVAVAVGLGLALAALGLALAGGLLALVYAIYRRATVAIPANSYGLATGFGSPAAGEAPALTPWLTGLINELAGIADPRHPLTFGDLWGLDRSLRERDPEGWAAEARQVAEDPRDRAINLEVMTTCITQGRPYRLPWRPRAARGFYFSRAEFEKFFQEEVVAWLEEHPPEAESDDEARQDALAAAVGLLPMPRPADLPVVVAARLSLSVPPLISAIPLYAVDPSLSASQRRFEPCWFSDGGIASNFPIHLFDAPLPRWPTFGINLRPLDPGAPPDLSEAAKVTLATENEEPPRLAWNRFGTPGAAATVGGPLAGFFGAILDTLQSWSDNLQLLQPGYQDRIAHLHLAKGEGGMNLNMRPEDIRLLSERGQLAGQRLGRRFATTAGDGTELTWDNHRWVRYRHTMAGLQGYLARLHRGYSASEAEDLSYANLITRDAATPPDDYRWETATQRDFAAEATGQVAKLGEEWARVSPGFPLDDLLPESDLRLVPRQ